MAAFVLSMEGVLLLGVIVWQFKAWSRALLSITSNRFALFVVVYVFISIVAFSAFGNFSILGRQRLQMLPVFFMLLAYPVKPTTLLRHGRSLLARKRQVSESLSGIG